MKALISETRGGIDEQTPFKVVALSWLQIQLTKGQNR